MLLLLSRVEHYTQTLTIRRAKGVGNGGVGRAIHFRATGGNLGVWNVRPVAGYQSDDGVMRACKMI
jgi:hypothetical protein